MILVTTPTGRIGGQVLASLLDAGDAAGPLRVVVRDPARLPSRIRDRVETVTGSHADPDVMAKACAGADRVFWLVPPSLTADSVEGHFRAFTRPLADAITTQGVERVVAVSTLGRGWPGTPGRSPPRWPPTTRSGPPACTTARCARRT